MRQLFIEVRPDQAGRVLALLGDAAADPVVLRGESAAGEPRTLLVLAVHNDAVGPLLARIDAVTDGAKVAFSPQTTFPLRLPLSSVDGPLRDPRRISAAELVLAALQSTGSWRGMLLYALFSGIIGAYAIILDVPYLLVGAMLVAPMGSPAMVSVVSLAIGDWRLLARGALRFGVSVLVLIATAAALGYAYGLTFSTATMESVTSISRWITLLALVAGAAGAHSQVEADRSSLVSGTSAGFLIAAALSPSAAVVGLSLVLGRWDYVRLMAFNLVLQYVALLAGGALLLVAVGVRPGGDALARGSGRRRSALVAAAALACALLLALHLGRPVLFRKADESRDLMEVVRRTVNGVAGARLVRTSAAFTRPDLVPGPRASALIEVMVEGRGGAAAAPALRREVEESLRREIDRHLPEVVPYLHVTVLAGPAR